MNRQRIAILLLSVLLVWGAFQVLGPFLPALCWAAILAFVSWPLYRRLRTALGKREGLAALGMTLLLSMSVILPVALLGASLVRDTVTTYQVVQADGSLSLGSLKEKYGELGTTVARVPIVGPQVQNWLREVDLPQVQQWLKAATGGILAFVTGIGQTLSQSLITLSLIIFSIYFLYASGESLLDQATRGLYRLGGEPLVSLLPPLAATVRSVVLGLLLTAIAQGFLAGVGLWVAGIKIALILGVIAGVLSILQIPTPVIWLPCVIWLAATGQTWQSVALFAWCALVVGTIDNILKPIFISQGTGLPFLLVFFGVIGGLIAFGTLGIVLGPLILSLLVILWGRWIENDEADRIQSYAAEE